MTVRKPRPCAVASIAMHIGDAGGFSKPVFLTRSSKERDTTSRAEKAPPNCGAAKLFTTGLTCLKWAAQPVMNNIGDGIRMLRVGRLDARASVPPLTRPTPPGNLLLGFHRGKLPLFNLRETLTG